MRRNAPLVEAFNSAPLPDAGMTLTFPQVTQKPLVGVVAAEENRHSERDTKIGAGNAPVQTFAGGEDVSRGHRAVGPSYLTISATLHGRNGPGHRGHGGRRPRYRGDRRRRPHRRHRPAFAARAGRRPQALYAESDGMWGDTLVIGIDLWAAMASAVDGDGRPLFPQRRRSIRWAKRR